MTFVLYWVQYKGHYFGTLYCSLSRSAFFLAFGFLFHASGSDNIITLLVNNNGHSAVGTKDTPQLNTRKDGTSS